MGKVIIIHGCPTNVEKSLNPEMRTYDKHWIPWTKRKLEEKGIVVETPLMPEPWSPDYEKYKERFEKLEIGEDAVLIGHSCGCAFLVRWLGETGRKVRKLILVAPWKIAYRKDGSDRDFYEYSIEPSVRENVEEIVMFTADDEGENGKKSLKIYEEALGGKVIELKGHGHYTLEGMGTEEFPELVGEISV